jgi:hypothetical protein
MIGIALGLPQAPRRVQAQHGSQNQEHNRKMLFVDIARVIMRKRISANANRFQIERFTSISERKGF